MKWFYNLDEEDIRDTFEEMTLTSKRFIFFPVNNNIDVSKAYGGSHWSLLVYYLQSDKRNGYFIHLDSLKFSGNINAAQKIANSVALMLPKCKKDERGIS